MWNQGGDKMAKSKKILIIIGAVFAVAIASTFFYTYKEVQKDNFKKGLISASCYSIKQEIVNASTAKFNKSTDSYLIYDYPDGTYTIHGYVTFLSKDNVYSTKPFSVHLLYSPKADKKYQIMSAEIIQTKKQP